MVSGIGGYNSGSYNYTVQDEDIKAKAQLAENTANADIQKEAVSLIDDGEDSAAAVNSAPAKSDPNAFIDTFKRGRDLSIFDGTSRFNEMKHADEAVMGMQKDDILDRYKYFVNPSETGLGTDADGTVRLKAGKAQ